MSRSITLAAAGCSKMQSFATTLLGKATGNAVALAPGAAAGAAAAIAIGEAPAGAHTVVTTAPEAKPALYKDSNVAFVRAVLPAAADQLPLRDLVDVYPASGIPCDAEIAQVKASFAKTAQTAVDLAKKNGNKLTVLVKQATKHARINELFEEAITEASAGSGVAVDFVGSAQVSNTLIMFPETLGVVAAADTASAENAEAMYAGLVGGVNRTFVGDDVSVAGGSSPNSVAYACAAALRNIGMGSEAKKIEAAIAKAKGNDEGASIVAAL
uniref:Uncharacterized protein n=1 Tax=Neobodo designis TaxID=312471 RepID=A0A7S1W7I6_NEODS|eukprot:CAMPEP_0174851740 /NCGR_PEP_ID=MMETSP1114-20130205/23646_1 /TAXON_ID=312471 /ORGANISM="Neobodo designis, Strain CCAP 1951/1" /LENGTH=269 /DNA_ID=CAMNT_0016086295 /DNA_START=30 /DNA_END=839 /DNA_ORIENTATION=+